MMLYGVFLVLAASAGILYLGHMSGAWGWFAGLVMDYLPLRNIWETAVWSILFGLLLFTFLVDLSRGFTLVLLVVFFLHLRRDFNIERKHLKKGK